ncbi:hypothetical protein ACFV0H_19390 [Streptomyces erythrochromogenes]|uniref:Uncharacterized protein n=1 Tax=Streptomyces erythrochromogenes TaxID=285574 RepID=A0ABZ1QGC1_9ACTN|nr:hypothetical protein [Streptomyces erythrochromogenes]MCX5587082.1 hypothetical protein [Streptomyces erythrochromogenes]
MTTNPMPRPPYERRQWLAVAVLFTVLAPAAAWLGQALSYGPGAPGPYALFYVVPFALVAATWIPPRTDAQRRRRFALGSAGCLLALFYPNVLLVTWLVLWALTAS